MLYFGITSSLIILSYGRFQKALKEYGVDDVDVFQTVDLWEKKDFAQVITTMFALGRTVCFILYSNVILIFQ